MVEARNQSCIQPVDPRHATGETRRLFGRVQRKLNLAPNLLRVLANAAVALEG